MTKGIYCYTDLNDGKIVYIGKDSNIHKNERHKAHFRQSNYNTQVINSVLQNNPDRYEYSIICEADHYSNIYLNLLEKGLIKIHKPKFNFTDGGEGLSGFKPSDETRRKISESLKGRCGKDCGSWKNYPRIIKRGFEKDSKQKYAIVFDGKIIKQSVHLDRLEKYLESIINGKKFVWDDFPRIVKHGFQNGKRRYVLIHKGKTIKQSIYLEKLQKELNLLINEVH